MSDQHKDPSASDDAEKRTAYGRAELSPMDDVVAGSYETWTLTYTVGELGLDDVSRVRVAHYGSDWGSPQFDDPAGDNYATVETSGDARVEASYETQGHIRPCRFTVTIDITDGHLEPGETITLTLGDRRHGCLGHRAQTFAESDFTLLVLVDPYGSGEFVRLPDELTFDVVPGRAQSIEAVAPTTVESSETVTVFVRVEDYWGNTATGYDGTLAVESADGVDHPDSVDVSGGVANFDVTVRETGTHRLTVVDEDAGFEATTNAVVAADDRDRRTFWGDIHGQSEETVGTGSVWDYFEHIRDYAFLDFGAHAGNDFQITDDIWDEITTAVREFHDPGSFTTFHCYEWSATPGNGGDHNVYFRGDDPEIHRSSNWLTTGDPGEKHQGTRSIEALYDRFESRDDVMIIPHQGGRRATLDVLDPDQTPFVEIASVWGVFEWFAEEALERGYPVGFVGGSDDHSGRPGTAYPTNEGHFNVKGGLMAVQAAYLTRESLWEAFHERRCYATTGERIQMDVSVAGTAMGGEVDVGDGTVEGDAFDQMLRIRPMRSSTSRDVTVAFEDDAVAAGTHPYFVRVSQVNGGMAWSSPVFVTVGS